MTRFARGSISRHGLPRLLYELAEGDLYRYRRLQAVLPQTESEYNHLNAEQHCVVPITGIGSTSLCLSTKF